MNIDALWLLWYILRFSPHIPAHWKDFVIEKNSTYNGRLPDQCTDYWTREWIETHPMRQFLRLAKESRTGEQEQAVIGCAGWSFAPLIG